MSEVERGEVIKQFMLNQHNMQAQARLLEKQKSVDAEKSRNDLRESSILLAKEKFKKSPHNQRSIEGNMRLSFKLEDIFSIWTFLAIKPAECEHNLESASRINLQGHLESVQLGIAGTLKYASDMKKMLSAQRTLLEAANASNYGWHVARYLDKEQHIFTEDDSANMKSLREAETFVRRDFKEVKVQRGAASTRGRGRGRRAKWTRTPIVSANQLANAIVAMQGSAGRGRGGSPQVYAGRFARGGKQLTCFGCGDTTHLIASCPKKS